MVILKFKGYDNINEIEKYKSRDLLITRDQAVDLAPDEYFITDLIGLAVVSDQGVELGTLKDVLETGANDVYVVAMKDGKELMLPAIGDCILNVDLEQRRMEVHVLEGLYGFVMPLTRPRPIGSVKRACVLSGFVVYKERG